MPDLLIQSMRGGQNDTDLPHLLAEDECQLALNVEFYYSACGERRLGMQSFSIIGSVLTTREIIVHLAEHFPGNDITQPEYFAVGATVGTTGVVGRYTSGAWVTVTPTDDIIGIEPDIYRIQTQELNGKLFFAYLSSLDRLHVWDGTNLRRTGLRQPEAAPTAVTEGAGAYATTRYFRIRYIEKNGTKILRRSEPSDSVTFVPPGGGAGATITRPALINEGETHWEVEASTDGATFFRIATVAVGTTTYNDEVNLATDSYANHGPASEPIGDYLLQPAARFIAADADRILLGGHFTDVEKKSRVSWSPVFADPGAGNDERQPLASGGDNFNDLDNFDGGGLTGLGQVMNGTVLAFKWQRVYKLSRTGDVQHAYEPLCISKTRGALPNSVVQAVDQRGRPCMYWLDPGVGPCSYTASGIEDVKGVRRTWKRFNYAPERISCHGVYYPDKQQVKWWISVDGATTPNLVIVLQTGALSDKQNGSVRGWTTADGVLAQAYCSAIWHEVAIVGGIQKNYARPFLGYPIGTGIQRSDVGDDDNGVAYRAKTVSRPYFLGGLLNKWGAMTSAVLADAVPGVTVNVSTIRDFGLEQIDKQMDLTPAAAEPFVIKQIDDLVMSEAYAIQFQFEDP